ncbi:hypothetical protein G9A89_022352 [Geosiphon pyriformis]|nr:hypothetical protein G9A89_022352 [Geosiphon pyriformis]
MNLFCYKVVYSEMQGRQNTGDSRIYLQAQRLMYPEGIGYRSETGGLMECIRKLNVDKIRNYHRDYYRPDNLCLVITGKVPHDKLLATLGPLDERIASKGPLSSYKRPWVESSPVPPITKSIEQVVEFPDEDESIGQIMISWQGPKVNEHLDLMALEILHKYLSDSAISVLQKEFVEIEEPLCTSISFNISQHIRAPILVEFSNVPTEELNELSSRIFPVLERVAKEGFDMNRMKTVIYRDKLKTLNYVETNPQSGFAIACITDFIYGKKNGEELEKAFKDLEYYDEVAKFTNEQWVGYLRKYYLDNPHITLLGKPSAAFAKSLAEDEKKRVETQIEELGSDKLKELDNLLEEAKNKNEVPVPPEIIEGFPIPQVEHIPLISVVTGRNQPILLFDNPVQDYLNQDSKVEPPYFIQYDHIRSSFVSISILISTTAVPAELRPYLEIFLDSFYSLPLNRPDGTKLTYEEVIKELNEDTVHYNYGLGASGAFEDLISFNIKVEASKYAKAIQWLRDLLWYTEFTSERLKIIASKLLNDIPANKRDGNKMASAVLRTVLFDPVKSNQYALNILCQERFLPEALKRLEETPEKVVEDLLRFRNILTRPENFRIHVVGDILKLKDPKGAWVENFLNIEPENPLVPVRLAQEVLTEFGKNPGHKGYIVSLPAIESTFSIHCAKGITAFDSPDLAPLLVLCELLQTMEGVFWRMIRGQGLAYSVWLQASVEAGLVYFAIYRSPDAFKAFDQARKVISDLSQKTAEFDLPSLEGAKSGVIYSIISSEKTMAMAATKSFISIVLKNLPPNHSHEMIKQVQAVTVDDLHRMLNKYLTNLFLAETSNVVVASAPGKVKDVQGGFAKHGFHLENKGLDNIIKLE